MGQNNFSNECLPLSRSPAMRRCEAVLVAWVRHELEKVKISGEFYSPANLGEKLPEILDFAQGFYQRYDAWLRQALAPYWSQIHCARGCFNCCHHFPLSVEPFELVFLYSELRTHSRFFSMLESCFARLKKWNNLSANSTHDAEETEDDREDRILQKYFSFGASCPFLDKRGSCLVHAFRPVTCRMYLSLSHPDFCTPAHLLTPNNRAFIVELPDILEEQLQELAGFYAPLQLSASLYEGILNLNAMEGEAFNGLAG